VAEPPSFVPRLWLVHPEDFGVEFDEEWRLAGTLEEAVQLARSIQQHNLARELHRERRRGNNSVADVAAVLGKRRETLAAKLSGHRPATASDLVLWSWMTKVPRLSVRPIAEITDVENPEDLVPRFPVPRGRDRK
jgi:hypothetical protein